MTVTVRALYNLGSALVEVRGFDDVRECWTRAIEAFTDCGSTEDADRVRARLEKIR